MINMNSYDSDVNATGLSIIWMISFSTETSLEPFLQSMLSSWVILLLAGFLTRWEIVDDYCESILRKTAGDASTYSPGGSSDQGSSKYRHVVILKQGKMVRKGRVDGMIGSMGDFFP
jgi:hypothetical protein